MKRFAAASAVFALVFFGVPSPANAASEECSPENPLGLVCVSIVNNEAVAVLRAVPGGPPLATARVPAPVETITETVTKVVTQPALPPVTEPGPTVTAPPPAPVTRTETPSPVTSTATVTASPTNTTGRQQTEPSDTLATKTIAPTLAQPEPVEPGGVDLIPDDPEVAAATGSLLGLIMGIILGLIGMYIVYRRGQADGEKATLKEFLGVIRGEPATTGRHRFDE